MHNCFLERCVTSLVQSCVVFCYSWQAQAKQALCKLFWLHMAQARGLKQTRLLLLQLYIVYESVLQSPIVA